MVAKTKTSASTSCAHAKCLTPDCDNPSRSRGICVACYAIYRKAIIAGAVAGWDVLVKAGLALASGHSSAARRALDSMTQKRKRSKR